MKVLLLPSWYIPQGGQFVRHQALALQEQGIDVAILANVALPWHTYKARELDLSRYPLHPIEQDETGIPTYRYYQRPIPRMPILNIRLWARRTVKLYARYAQKHGHPDLIHVHSGTWGAYAAALIKEKWGIPYVVTEHRGMFGYKCELARRFFRPEFDEFFIKGFSHADCLIPVSDQLTARMRTYCRREVPIRVVGNIVDTRYFDCAGRTAVAHEPFRFVSVNGYYEVKGYDILLQAWDLLCDRRGDAVLTIAGENFDQPAFQQMLARCRYRHLIRLTGELPREGVKEELKKADAFVMSSRVEAAPVAILEALSSGLPIVGTDVIPGYALTEKEGIRVGVEDPQALADGMERMMNERSRYLPEALHQHAVNIAAKEHIAGQLIDIYRSVLNGELHNQAPQSR